MRTASVEKVFYKKGELLTFDEAKSKAFLFLDYINLTDEDLCDYWYGLSDNWDLNIWLDVDDPEYKDEEEKYLRMTLYKVVNGKTTQDYTRIFPLEFPTRVSP